MWRFKSDSINQLWNWRPKIKWGEGLKHPIEEVYISNTHRAYNEFKKNSQIEKRAKDIKETPIANSHKWEVQQHQKSNLNNEGGFCLIQWQRYEILWHLRAFKALGKPASVSRNINMCNISKRLSVKLSKV